MEKGVTKEEEDAMQKKRQRTENSWSISFSVKW